MRYHKKLVIDVISNKVLHDEVVEYDGPVAECKGPKVKTQTVTAPPPSAEETESRRLGLFAQRQSLYEAGWDPDTMQRRALTAEEQRDKDMDALIQQRMFEELQKKPGEVSPAQQKALDELYGAEQSKMDEELKRFAVESAGARGISATDTPLARELFLAKGRGQTELGAARATAKLNFADKERLFQQGASQWRQDLAQQRFANLAGLGGGLSQQSIGFMGARAGLKPSVYQSGGGGGSNVGGIISGAGAAVGGVAMAL